MSISHFDEKSGVVPFCTNWGKWWQTVDEVHIELVDLPNVKSKEVLVVIKPSYIQCSVKGNIIFQGNLHRIVHADDSIWTLEENGTILNIVLPKADYTKKEIIWESLLANDGYRPDTSTLHEMRKKIDLEKFQIENPGFNFSNAKLAKS